MFTINDLLLYGHQYHLWRDGQYLGIATWTDDENIGDAFVRMEVDSEGILTHLVFYADKMEIIYETRRVKKNIWKRNFNR